MNTENKLEVQNVYKKYINQNAARGGEKYIKALDGVSLALTPGIYALLGPNGAGKSTLINILTRNLYQDKGQILWNGKGIIHLAEKYLKVIGYMPQQQAFYESFTGREFLVYIAALKALPKKECAKIIDETAQKVNLTKQLDRKINTYSGGMRQRLLCAAAVLGKPKLLIMDEPTAGLDPQERSRFKEMLKDLAQDSIVLIATHVVADIENISKEIIIMRSGKIADSGTPSELIEKYAQGENLEKVYLNIFGEEEKVCE